MAAANKPTQVNVFFISTKLGTRFAYCAESIPTLPARRLATALLQKTMILVCLTLRTTMRKKFSSFAENVQLAILAM